jgi:hypothetical protein
VQADRGAVLFLVPVGRLDGGKIKENTDCWNMAELLSQIGLLTVPAGADG